MTIIDSRNGITPKGYEVPKDAYPQWPTGCAGGIVEITQVSGCDETLDKTLYYEVRAQVLQDGAELAQMRRLVNEWEWRPGHGQGGHHPHRLEEVYVPLWRPLTSGDRWYQDQTSRLVRRAPDLVLVAVETRSGRVFVVKCSYEELSARQMVSMVAEAGLSRTVARKTAQGPDGTVYEVPWTWFDPIEVVEVDTDSWDLMDLDPAVDVANRWGSELRQEWSAETDHSIGDDILLSPDQMPQRANPEADELAAVLDAVAQFQDPGFREVVRDEESLAEPDWWLHEPV